MSNYTTGAEYQGGNQIILDMVKRAHEEYSDKWLTFVQAKKAGMMVRKGSKGVRLRTFVKKEKKKGISVCTDTVPVYFTVFNLAQCVSIIR